MTLAQRAAHVEEAVPQVQIAVTDATGLDLDTHFRPDWVRTDGLRPFERLAVTRELRADHRALRCVERRPAPRLWAWGFGL